MCKGCYLFECSTKIPSIEILFRFFFILDMNLQFVYVAFTGLGLQAGDCCGEVSGPGKV
jgi:hypothetical protein